MCGPNGYGSFTRRCRGASRYYGHLDVVAEPVDPALASAIARRLPSVAVWLSSPLLRTRVTALALKSGVDPVAIGDFTDQHYGRWQGMSYNDVFAANRTARLVASSRHTSAGG